MPTLPHLPSGSPDPEVEPLATWLAQRARGAAPVIGLNGSQGSGKSTLAATLRETLRERHGLRAAVLALDDLYRTRAERERLSRDVHPLLTTRGVPGTHDLELGAQVLRRLRALGAGETAPLPAFDKLADDRAPESAWRVVAGPVDVILFEGWCVGTPPQTEADLAAPVNALEADEDADGRWRRYVNDRLAGEYRQLFAGLAATIFLAVPDFDTIFRWRLQQENETARAARVATSALMDPARLRRFIQHYERLTRHALRVMPDRADVVLDLGPEHQIVRARYRPPLV